MCNITANSKKGKAIIDADVLIFDEVGMTDKYILDAINRTIQKLCDNEHQPFAGKTVVFGGGTKNL